MKSFIEVTGIQGTKYVINTNWIIYVEEIYHDESKTLIVLDKEVPICKNGVLKEPCNLYVKDEYKSLIDRLI